MLKQGFSARKFANCFIFKSKAFSSPFLKNNEQSFCSCSISNPKSRMAHGFTRPRHDWYQCNRFWKNSCIPPTRYDSYQRSGSKLSAPHVIIELTSAYLRGSRWGEFESTKPMNLCPETGILIGSTLLGWYSLESCNKDWPIRVFFFENTKNCSH